MSDQHVTVPRGNSRVIRTILDEPGEIVGWEFGFAIRRHQDEPDETAVAVDEDTEGVTIEVTFEGDAENPAIIDTFVPAGATITLEKHNYWWSLNRTNPGFEVTIAEGLWRSTNTAVRL